MIHTNERIIKHKVGLLNLAEELGNVSKAREVMSLSRNTFYRYNSAVEEADVEALMDANRLKPNPKNRVDEKVEQAVIEYAIEQPAHGEVRVSNELRKRGVFVSASGMCSIWLRHELENFKLRLKALEVKVAENGVVLTGFKAQALARKKHADEACCEIETAHPGYLGSQDTFYVGTLKGVVRVTNRRLLTLTAKWLKPSCTPPKRRSPLRICLMIVFCLTTNRMSYQYCEC